MRRNRNQNTLGNRNIESGLVHFITVKKVDVVDHTLDYSPDNSTRNFCEGFYFANFRGSEGS